MNNKLRKFELYLRKTEPIQVWKRDVRSRVGLDISLDVPRLRSMLTRKVAREGLSTRCSFDPVGPVAHNHSN